MIGPDVRSVKCPVCGTRHVNVALCDHCADLVALRCPYDGIEGCDCVSCKTATRAAVEFVFEGCDLNVYLLPEVKLAREGLGTAKAWALAWERGYEPTPEALTLHAETLDHEYREGCGCDGCVSHERELERIADEMCAAVVIDLDGEMTSLTTGDVLVEAPETTHAEVA